MNNTTKNEMKVMHMDIIKKYYENTMKLLESEPNIDKKQQILHEAAIVF